jgi:hypothetical protein
VAQRRERVSRGGADFCFQREKRENHNTKTQPHQKLEKAIFLNRGFAIFATRGFRAAVFFSSSSSSDDARVEVLCEAKRLTRAAG